MGLACSQPFLATPVNVATCETFRRPGAWLQKRSGEASNSDALMAPISILVLNAFPGSWEWGPGSLRRTRAADHVRRHNVSVAEARKKHERNGHEGFGAHLFGAAASWTSSCRRHLAKALHRRAAQLGARLDLVKITTMRNMYLRVVLLSVNRLQPHETLGVTIWGARSKSKNTRVIPHLSSAVLLQTAITNMQN